MPRPTITTEEFIARAITKLGNKYDYTKTVFVNSTTPLIITCPVHGDITKRPNTITVNGSGCKRCAVETTAGAYHKKDTSWFIETANNIHGEKYDYSLVEYTQTHNKVTIICPEHGQFQQTPASHIYQRCGCNACSVKDYAGGYGKTRFNNHPEIKDNPATLYLIKCTSNQEVFLKIGITQHTLHYRFRVSNRLPYEYTLMHELSGTLYDLFLLEQSIKKRFSANKYRPLVKFNGHTECLDVTVTDAIITAFVPLKKDR